MTSAPAMKCLAFVTMYSLAATWVSLPEGQKVECRVSLGGLCLTERQGAKASYQDYPRSFTSPGRRRRSSSTSDEKQTIQLDAERDLSKLIIQLMKMQNEINQSMRAILNKLSSIEVMQRRSQGDVDFNKNWDNYKNGFGTPDTDFWLGLDLIHKLTSQGFTELRIDLMFQGKRYFAHYSNFQVANETMNYKLSISGYNGTSGDSFTQHHGMGFTTVDRDNDKNPHDNCGTTSGWWFDNCYYSNLNGVWNHQEYMGPHWNSLHRSTSLGFTEMKVRQASDL